MTRALEFYGPKVKEKLTGTEKSLQGWRKGVRTTPHPICLEQTIYLIAYDLFSNGDYDVATGLLVTFDCYLRVDSLCRLTVNGIILMDNRQRAYPVAFTLEKTKTGRLQCALLRPLFLVQLNMRLVWTRRFIDEANAGFMPSTANTISNELGASRRRLNQEHPCTLRSFRYGGATRDTIYGSVLSEDVMHRGRLRSEGTMSSYVSPAQYMRIFQALTTEQKQFVDSFHKNLFEHFNTHPPEQRDRTDKILNKLQYKSREGAHLGHMLTL